MEDKFQILIFVYIKLYYKHILKFVNTLIESY